MSNLDYIKMIQDALLQHNLRFTNSQYQLSLILINYFKEHGNKKIAENIISYSLPITLKKLSENVGCSITFLTYTMKNLQTINLFNRSKAVYYLYLREEQ